MKTKYAEHVPEPNLTKIINVLSHVLLKIRVATDLENNPLPGIADAARMRYSVVRIDDTTLQLTGLRPIHSLLTLGYCAFHARLRYGDGTLYGSFFVRCYSLFELFIPTQYTIEPLVSRGVDGRIEEILDWAGSTRRKERTWLEF